MISRVSQLSSRKTCRCTVVPVVVDWSVGSMRRMFTVEKVVVVMMGCLMVFSHWLQTIYVLAQDGYVASPAPGL